MHLSTFFLVVEAVFMHGEHIYEYKQWIPKKGISVLKKQLETSKLVLMLKLSHFSEDIFLTGNSENFSCATLEKKVNSQIFL